MQGPLLREVDLDFLSPVGFIKRLLLLRSYMNSKLAFTINTENFNN